MTTPTVDTQAAFLDYKRLIIGGYIAPYSDAQHLTIPGKSHGLDHLSHKGAYYVTPHTTVYCSTTQHIWLFAHHHHDLGPIGYLQKLWFDEHGVRIEAQLRPEVKHLNFETQGRTLPKLLRGGKLFYSPMLGDPVIAPDGWLLRADLLEITLTAHPATPKARKH